MNPLELALARSKAYTLFEQLYLHGINPTTKPSLEQLPELVDSVDFDRSFDEFAAEHYALFIHNLPPYASVFLENDGQPGGNVTEAAMQAFRECGFKPSTTSEGADHIGHILGCLGFICGAESDAWEDGRHHIAGQMRQIQVELLEEQLLPWIFPFWWSVNQSNNRFYRELADLTLNISIDHYGSLQNLHTPQITKLEKESQIDIEQMKLKDIVSHLLKPAKSGSWVSANDLGELGQSLNLPRGFGDRQTTALNLMKAAGKYNQFGQLLQTLSDSFSEAHLNFDQFKNESPFLSRYIFPWSLKLCATNKMLHELIATWEKDQLVEI